ncbi:MAG: hypothetical protein VYC34_01175, partial [Planctomycetota bacterium]|nr:hypothetical protein [Planctomycetota bacterium]
VNALIEENEELDLIEETLEEHGARWEDIGLPEGMIGLATWFAPADDGVGLAPRTMFVIDFGDRAADVAGIIEDIAIDKERDGAIEMRETDLGDVTAITISPIVEEAEEFEAENEWDDWEPPAGPETWLGLGWLLSETPPDFTFAQVDSYIVVANHVSVIERVMDGVEGRLNDALAGEAAFAAAMGPLERPEAYQALFIRPMVEAAIAEDAVGVEVLPGVTLLNALRGLGLDGIRSFGFGVKLDGPDAMVEGRYAADMDRREGIFALLEPIQGGFTPPPFVSADAAGVMMLKFDFSRAPQAIQQAVTALPLEAREMIEPQLALALPAATPLLQSIGPDVTITDFYRQPFDPTSESSLITIAVKNAQVVSGMITQYGAMAGVQSRDFEGNQIFEAPDAVGEELVVGLGFGQAFIGPREVVENAMRLAGAPNALRMADDEDFRAAARLAAPAAEIYDYTAIEPGLRYMEWARNNIEQVLRSQMAPFAGQIEDEVIDQWVEEAAAELRAGPQPPATDVLARYLGEYVSDFRMTSQGFVGRVFLREAK